MVNTPSSDNKKRYTINVPTTSSGDRLDKYLAQRLNISRSQLKKLINNGLCTIDGIVVAKPAHQVQANDHIVLTVQKSTAPPPTPTKLEVPIVYLDEHLAVVNKPAGMVVHPSKGHTDNTLVNAMLHQLGELPINHDVQRPGIVHRIDKDTSGLLVVARTDDTVRSLADQFSKHSISRTYRAITVKVHGPGLSPDAGTISTMHARNPSNRLKFTGDRGDREAITHYHIREHFEHGAAIVTCTLETGRTHQIRMHMREAGAPILGDRLYGGQSVGQTPLINRMALHAQSLGFVHPATGEELSFSAPPPDDIAEAIHKLRQGADWR